jgi:hypothetical protein
MMTHSGFYFVWITNDQVAMWLTGSLHSLFAALAAPIVTQL